MILQCFDLIHQRQSVIQYILCQDITGQELHDYIEHKFIEIDGIDTKWHVHVGGYKSWRQWLTEEVNCTESNICKVTT